MITGALIDFHSNPDRLLNKQVRTGIKVLTESNSTAAAEIRLLEELALVGGLSHEQITAAMVPSAAEREFMEKGQPANIEPVHFTLTQSVPIRADEKTHLPYILFAGHRAGTPIFLAPSEEFNLKGVIEGHSELAAAAAGAFTLGVGPSAPAIGGPLKMPARLVVDQTARTIRMRVGQFSCTTPTSYPIAVSLPIYQGSSECRGTLSMLIQLSELTVGDLRAIEAANALARQHNARIELILDSTGQVIASIKQIEAKNVFDLHEFDDMLNGLYGLDDSFPAPILVPDETLREISRLSPTERSARWEAERSTLATKPTKVATLYMRLTTADGMCCDERFVRHMPFDWFPPPFARNQQCVEAFDQWTDGTGDFLLTAYFGADVHQLAGAFLKWCADLGEFPFNFKDSSPGPTTRSMLTIRALAKRDRIWHLDRPFIFEFRPVTRREAYQMEADYWRSVGDSPRAELAEELRDAKDLSAEFGDWMGKKGKSDEASAADKS